MLSLEHVDQSLQIVGVYALPLLRDRLLPYGSRGSTERDSSSEKTNGTFKDAVDETLNAGNQPFTEVSKTSSSYDMIDIIACIRVPHSYFTHFYITSFAASLFWLYQLYTRGSIAQWFFSRSSSTGLSATPATSMTLGQVWLLWTLLFMQGFRRLVESYVFSKPSKSTMHVTHWLTGIAFYLADSIAIWIEGVPALGGPGGCPFPHKEMATARGIIGVSLFVVASVLQNRAHACLASLTSYQIPPGNLFRYVLCPHYTAEVVIYFCFAMLAAPRNQWMNGTMVAALIFVTTNLGVTANGTRQWYLQHFSTERVGRRARLIPFIW